MSAKSLLFTVATAATVLTMTPAIALETGSALQLAQSAPGSPERAESGMGHRHGGPRTPLFTPDEHSQFRQKMESAKTPEERDAVRKAMRAAMEQRAKEKGVTLLHHARGPMGGRAADGPMSQLFSEQERTAFREKMRNAKDRDERRKIAQEMHASAQTRAKEKGIELPQRGHRGSHHMPEHGKRNGAPNHQHESHPQGQGRHGHGQGHHGHHGAHDNQV